MLINEKLTTETAAALEAGMELGADGAKFEKFEGVPVIVPDKIAPVDQPENPYLYP